MPDVENSLLAKSVALLRQIRVWIDARSRDDLSQMAAAAGGIWQILFGLTVLAVSLKWMWWIAMYATAPLANSPFKLVTFAACASTAVTVCLILLDRPPSSSRRLGNSPVGGPFRFWLTCFTLLAGITLVSTIFARIPNEIETPWLRAPRPVPVCPPVKPGSAPPAGPAVVGLNCP